jgi:hypothetical protein
MPKRLPGRFKPDSIAEFRAAARQRSLDAIVLEEAGRRSGAIYLWGYVAEMILKAAFFDVSGFPHSRTLTRPDLRTALITYAGAASNANLHDLDLWAGALVNLRGRLGSNYADPTFANLVRTKAQTLHGLWSVELRYHRNIAYSHEIAQAQEAAKWLLTRSLDL